MRRYLGLTFRDEFPNEDCIAQLPFMEVEVASTDLAQLDPHESSCFGLRSQRLIRLIGSVKCMFFISEILIKVFGLVFQQHNYNHPRSVGHHFHSCLPIVIMNI